MGCAQSVLQLTGLGAEETDAEEVLALVEKSRVGRPEVLRRSLLQIQQAVQADESKTLAERIARVDKVGQIFKAWVVSRDPKVQAPGLAVLAVLAHHDHAAKVLCQRELLEQLAPPAQAQAARPGRGRDL